MKEKKHIDRLFQEKFKDFEVSPNEAVWQNISNRIHVKKKRRLLPLWSRIAGVAALFAVFFGVGNQFIFNSSPSVADIEESPIIEPEQIFDPVQVANKKNVSSRNSNGGFSEEVFANENFSISKNKRKAEALQANKSTEDSGTLRRKIESLAGNSISLPYIGNSILIAAEDFTAVQLYDSNKSNLENNPLFKLEKQKEEEELLATNGGSQKLKISTFAAPIYFNGIGNGNSIDPQFSDNKKEGEVTMSYGVHIAYAVNDKIKIRSGVSKVAMSYNTMDIAYSPSVDPVALRYVDYDSNAQLMQVQDSYKPISSSSFAPEVNSLHGAGKSGYLNQRLGFIELPVEIEFSVLDKRLGINLIGGASTLFLDENSISVNSGDFSTHLGESSNLNNVSFSTNIGLGMDYKLSKSFQFNLEPMFKYQLNTFNSGDFKPYYLGVYTGFSYKF